MTHNRDPDDYFLFCYGGAKRAEDWWAVGRPVKSGRAVNARMILPKRWMARRAQGCGEKVVKCIVTFPYEE